MGYKVLYRKYRPQNFRELVGQEFVKETLIGSIVKDKIAHAYIFTGPRGTGKTSTAKIFAKVLNCLSPVNGDSCGKCKNCLNFSENPDIIEIDAASNNGVDEIREIRNNVKLVPSMSKYKIYIIDEVHMLSNSAWNAFLKTLEEPPAHVIFIFATTDIQKVPITVLSRCQRFDFKKLTNSEIREHLLFIAEKENIDIDDASVDLLATMSDGCLRDCLSYLDQLSKITNNITVEIINETFGLVSNQYIDKIIKAIYENDIEEFLKIFQEIQIQGIDINSLVDEMLSYLIDQSISIKKGNDDVDYDFDFCKKIIDDLFDIETKLKLVENAYNLLLISFLTYFQGNQPKIAKKENISQKKVEKNISREIKTNKIDDNFLFIRINNAFYGAQKSLKQQFCEYWKDFIYKLGEYNNYNLLGYVNSATVEVVSDSNVIFSTDIQSDSIIFNNNLNLLEREFEKIENKTYKFICLFTEECNKIKKDYIVNKNKYDHYIEEDEQKQDGTLDSVEQDAKEVFGDIIEIN